MFVPRKIKVKLCGIGLSSDAIYLDICDPSPEGSAESRVKSRAKNVLIGNGWEEDEESELLDAYRLKSAEDPRVYALRVEGSDFFAQNGGEFERVMERMKREQVQPLLKKMNLTEGLFVTKYREPFDYELRPKGEDFECEISLDKIGGRYEISCRSNQKDLHIRISTDNSTMEGRMDVVR